MVASSQIAKPMLKSGPSGKMLGKTKKDSVTSDQNTRAIRYLRKLLGQNFTFTRMRLYLMNNT